MQEKEVYEYLTAHGVKASVQRVAVMQYLLQQMGHPTVDEIYQALVDHIPTLSKIETADLYYRGVCSDCLAQQDT